MKKFVRVYLKGDPLRWVDLPLPDETQNLFGFIGQMRFEGYVCAPKIYIPLDEVRGVSLIELGEPSEPIDFTRRQ